MNVQDIRTYNRITSAKSQSFSWQLSAQDSPILRSSYLRHVTAAMTQWMNTCYLHLSESQKNTDLRTHEFSHSPDLSQYPRLANVACVSSWRRCGISPAIVTKSSWMLFEYPFPVLFCSIILLY
jgi:hypothetical protein